MNSREFFTQALLSRHKVLMEATLADEIPDDDDELDEEVLAIAGKVSKVAAYALLTAFITFICAFSDLRATGAGSSERHNFLDYRNRYAAHK